MTLRLGGGCSIQLSYQGLDAIVANLIKQLIGFPRVNPATELQSLSETSLIWLVSGGFGGGVLSFSSSFSISPS